MNNVKYWVRFWRYYNNDNPQFFNEFMNTSHTSKISKISIINIILRHICDSWVDEPICIYIYVAYNMLISKYINNEHIAFFVIYNAIFAGKSDTI